VPGTSTFSRTVRQRLIKRPPSAFGWKGLHRNWTEQSRRRPVRSVRYSTFMFVRDEGGRQRPALRRAGGPHLPEKEGVRGKSHAHEQTLWLTPESVAMKAKRSPSSLSLVHTRLSPSCAGSSRFNDADYGARYVEKYGDMDLWSGRGGQRRRCARQESRL
jgi:hypothetical protein